MRASTISLPFAAALMALAGTSAAAERIPLSISLEARGYRRIAEKRGTAVFQHEGSDIIRVAAEGRFAFPPEAVEAALLDYPRQVKAIARLSEAKVIGRGPRMLRVYQRLNLPIVDDRDFTLEVRWGRDGQARWVVFRALPAETVPRRRGVVRVTVHDGAWLLQPIEGGRATLARFTTALDMAGLIPRWMVRSGSCKEMPQLFDAIGELLRQAQPRRVAWSSK